MFNDKYGLTEAVLSGRKTMTRRILKVTLTEYNTINLILNFDENLEANKLAIIKKYSQYQIGQVLAVAQSYKEIRDIIGDIHDGKSIKFSKGWNNKMFVRADLMPHHIRITNIKVERLRDISNEDCIKEGIVEEDTPIDKGYSFYGTQGNWETPREAFAFLIDKVSGKGTWKRNPWVFAYEFELID